MDEEAWMSRCINCGADVSERRKHDLKLAEVQSVIRQWVAPQIVDEKSVICHSCWCLALLLLECMIAKVPDPDVEPSSSGHHRHVCINCGISIRRKRSHILDTNSERETRIRNTVMDWIQPRQLQGSDHICHPCWLKSDRAASRLQISEPQSTRRTRQSTINPHLTTPGDTQASTDILLEEPSMTMDEESQESLKTYCVNCGTDVSGRRKHDLKLAEVYSVIRQWVAPQIVDEDSVICHSCWTVALQNNHVPDTNIEPSTSGHHRHVCVNCRISIRRKRSHMLHTNSERETLIRNTVIDWIQPRQLQESDRICHPCWQKSYLAASRLKLPEPQPTGRLKEPTMNLPNLTRAVVTQAHCFFPQCGSHERCHVPKWLRVKLFRDYKYYVPNGCRICSYHLKNDNWAQLASIQQPIHSFTATHIEDFATFVNEKIPILDFSNVEVLTDDTVHYWIGLSKEELRQLYADIPRLPRKNGEMAIAAYLMKLRTGATDERISKLLNVPRTTLMRLMNKARTILNDYVPNL